MEPSAHDNLITLANQHYNGGRFSDAESLARQILQQDPDHPQALNISALVAQATGRLPMANAFIQRALKISPDNAKFHNNLGMILFAGNRIDESMPSFKKAIELQPSLAEAHNNLSTVLRIQGDIDAAFAEVRTAIQLDPSSPDALCNYADLMLETGRLDEAVKFYDRAIAMRPTAAQYHINLASALLKLGDFPRGWAEYEWRWKRSDFAIPSREYPHPRWDGQPLKGRRILLHVEQGFGDTLQFIRYAPLVARRGGKILVQCQPPLYRLLQGIPAIDRLVRLGDPLPPFVVHCPIMSLPFVLGTTLPSIPADVPYIKPDPVLVDRFKAKFNPSAGAKKIGLAWAGSKRHMNDRNRSLPISALNPLMKIPRLQFYSLQTGDSARDLATLRDENPAADLIDCAPEIHDFADTAAIVAGLDLIITVDSSVAHLAGAMGKPVWLLLPLNADFRWLVDRDDSPWYPTMRLFRQTKRADWTDPLRQIIQILQTQVPVK